MTVLLFSAALLVPCFWQSRIQSADLSSHIYNAWLATLIRQGAAPGLRIAPQTNNVLFDLMLEWLLVRLGSSLAQRLAVSVSVLVFGWGAIRFIFRVAGRNWWFAAPCVAMLAYGFIFHMGFFNFYLSMGLSLWYLSFFWSGTWRIRVLAVPLLLLAWMAHPFPVVWAIGIAGYIVAAGSIQPRRRILLLISGLLAILIARFILTHQYLCSWSPQQALFITGANQIVLFGAQYMLPFTCLLVVWLLLLRKLAKLQGMAHLISTVPFQLWLLSAAAVFLMPDQVMLPQFARPLGFIASRLSFGAAVMMCAVLAGGSTSRLEKIALASAAALFFALLCADDHELNQREDRLDAAVRQLPAGQRVIATLPSPSLRSLCLHHDLDRACVGQCFSYANYEAASQQFRIRAFPGNGMVLDNNANVEAAAGGTYVVQPRDLPVYLAYPCGSDFRNFCLRPLQAGERTGGPH